MWLLSFKFKQQSNLICSATKATGNEVKKRSIRTALDVAEKCCALHWKLSGKCANKSEQFNFTLFFIFSFNIFFLIFHSHFLPVPGKLDLSHVFQLLPRQFEYWNRSEIEFERKECIGLICQCTVWHFCVAHGTTAHTQPQRSLNNWKPSKSNRSPHSAILIIDEDVCRSYKFFLSFRFCHPD